MDIDFTTTVRTFDISPMDAPKAIAKMETLNRRAVKLGLHPFTFALGPEVLSDNQPKDLAHKFYVRKMTVIGKVPVISGGWTFVATLRTDTNGVIRVLPGTDLDIAAITPRDGECDHCGINRRRSAVYFLRNNNGDLQQVGSSCITAYTGLTVPALDMMFDGKAWSEFRGQHGEERYGIDDIIGHALNIVRVDGTYHRADSFSVATVTNVRHLLGFSTEKVRRETAAEYGATPADATAVVEWVRQQPATGDYMTNLVRACSTDDIAASNIGIVTSAVAAYNREMAKNVPAKADKPASQHIGTIGARQDFTITVTREYVMDSMYGERAVYTAETPEGSIVQWWTNPGVLETGKTYTGKATIKNHDDYKGTAQTTITRGRFEVVD